MKNKQYKKVNRIALISIAVAVLMACNSLTAFAAQTTPSETSTKVIYSGNGTTQTVSVKNADNLDTFKNLMPNGSTKPQDIFIENSSGKNMQVYFGADTTGNKDKALSQKLLDTLVLKVTFKMDDNAAEQTLYDGIASGKTGKDIITNTVSLGYVYAKSTSGRISATLTAPETMDNEFRNASAEIKWIIQFQLQDDQVNSHSGGGGNGGGGGGTIIETLSLPTESIAAESTPQGGPASAVAGETIINENVPLSKPPKTGDNGTLPWIILAVAVTAGLVFIITRRKLKTDASGKNG